MSRVGQTNSFAIKVSAGRCRSSSRAKRRRRKKKWRVFIFRIPTCRPGRRRSGASSWRRKKNEPGSAQKGNRDGLDSPTWPTRSSSDFGRGKEVIAFYQRSQTSSALTPATHLVSQTGRSHPGRQPRTETTANHNNPRLPSASINPPFPNHLSSNIFRKRRKINLKLY